MIRVAVLLAMCAFSSAEENKDDPRVLAEGKAPTPFTAEEIRAASPPGRVSLFRLTGDGQSVLVRFRFGPSDAEAVQLETVHLSAERKPLARPRAQRVSWRDLQAHASYDAKATTIADATVEVPLGKFDCLQYTLRAGNRLQRFYFARELPGPPVKMTLEVDGKLRQEMELVEHRCFDYAKVFGPQAARASGKIPADWKIEARVAPADESGALKLVATLRGQGLPARSAVRVEEGPLKGAVFPVERTAEGDASTCAIALPAPFRMKPGALEVRVLSP